jgi:hypothetical protein
LKSILRAFGRASQAVPWNSEESIREELFSLERLETIAQLFCESMHRTCEITDLARSSERWTSREISGRQGTRDVAQLHHWASNRSRDQPPEDERQCQRDGRRA